MANIFQSPSHVAKIGYNGFDMSNLLKFSSTTGELLPIYHDILQPGDKVSCSTELKTRTMPMASAAMCSLTEHIEWFFVPLTQIYSLFGAFYFNVDDISSSVYERGNVHATIPYVPASNFAAFLRDTGNAADGYFSGYTGTSLRLLELLGIPVSRMYQSTEVVTPLNKGICPLLLCAYQKIYFDFYRNSERESNNPSAYNLDKYYSTAPAISSQDFKYMSTLRYRRWKPDFFTNVVPSPLFGEVGIGSMGQFGNVDFSSHLVTAFHNWIYGSFTGLSGANVPVSNQTVDTTGSLNTQNPSAVTGAVSRTQWSLNSDQNVANTYRSVAAATSPTNIRASFAVQKLMEITRRAGKHYDAQQLAHFGVKLPKGVDGEVQFLGHSESKINIGDVIATAAGNATGAPAGASTSVLGQVGGKGYGYGQGSHINFTAPCHGILMAIYSCEPDVDYTSVMYDKLNLLMERADWFTPEFDNLGMQPLFGYQCTYANLPTTDDSVRGWQWRYSELKCKYNRVTGSLARTLAYWSPQRSNVGSTNLSNFLVSPNYLDLIMLVPYSFDTNHETKEQLFGNDPLFHEVYFDVKKASKMSTYGLEQL